MGPVWGVPGRVRALRTAMGSREIPRHTVSTEPRWHRLGTRSKSGAPDDPEAPDVFGGPSRTRTLDPLIKSGSALHTPPAAVDVVHETTEVSAEDGFHSVRVVRRGLAPRLAPLSPSKIHHALHHRRCARSQKAQAPRVA